MTRIKDLSWVLAALLLLGALYIYGIRALGSGEGFAQGLDVAGSGQASTTASTTTPASSEESTVKSTPAAPSRASATMTQTDIENLRLQMARSPRIAAALLTRADTKMETSVRLFDRNADKLGDSRVADLLSSRLGKSPNALKSEHHKLHTSWGQLMIANRLAASCGNPRVTPGMLLRMKAHGMGWGRIAAGLGLKVGSCVKSVGAEARMAKGCARGGARGVKMQAGGVRGDMSSSVGRCGGMQAGMHAGMGAGMHAGMGHGHGMRFKFRK